MFTGWRPPSLLRRPAAETNTNARCLHHIVSRRARSIAAASIALVALVATAAPAPAAAPPAVVLSYYNARDLKRIVTLLGSAGLPAGTPVYYGNYYGTSPPRKKGGPHKPPPPPVTVPNGRQAPIFPFSPSKFWDRRSLPANQRAAAGGGSLAGPAPSLARLLRGSASLRLAWGRELGQRFRDRVRAVNAKGGTPIAAWQLDEIPANAVGTDGRRIRELVRGMLDGLHDGRPQLGDQPQPGIVFMANHALALTSAPETAELRAFWSTLDADSTLFVGEEYPKYAGDPERAAFVMGAGQRHLAAGDAAMQSLARKYVVGITPGYIPAINLGGNTDSKSPEGATAWRADFLDARARTGIAGFAAYNLRLANASSGVLGSMLQAFGDALGAYGGGS